MKRPASDRYEMWGTCWNLITVVVHAFLPEKLHRIKMLAGPEGRILPPSHPQMACSPPTSFNLQRDCRIQYQCCRGRYPLETWLPGQVHDGEKCTVRYNPPSGIHEESDPSSCDDDGPPHM